MKLRRLLPIILVALLLLPVVGWATAYTVGSSGCDYTTIQDCISGEDLGSGDRIIVYDSIYREQIIIGSDDSGSSDGYVTIEAVGNVILDGTVTFNGLWTFDPAGTYSETQAWSQAYGEVYRKRCRSFIPSFYEDDLQLTPVVITVWHASTSYSIGDLVMPTVYNGYAYKCTTAGTSDTTEPSWPTTFNTTVTDGSVVWTCISLETAIPRGHYSWWSNGWLFYRASDGQTPSEHDLYGCRRDKDSVSGLIHLESASYIKIKGFTIRRWKTGATKRGGIVMDNCNHVVISDVSIQDCRKGMQIIGCSNVNLNLTLGDNEYGGLGIEGDCSDIDISGSFMSNGRWKAYVGGTSYDYYGDGDNIGIGYGGGTLTNILIHDAVIINAGPPDGNSREAGAGIFVGTSNTMDAGVSILRCVIEGSHAGGIHLGNKWTGGTIAYNKIIDNVNYPGSRQAVYLNLTNPSFTSSSFINNTVCDNNAIAALCVDGNATLTIANNIFYNNGQSSSFYGDIWFWQADISSITEKNNCFFRSGTDWDDEVVINRNGTKYDLDHIVGSISGYWQYDSGKGENDIVSNPKLSSTYHLSPNSPCIDAGVKLPIHDSNWRDLAGNRIRYGTAPDIGCYEHKTWPRGAWGMLPWVGNSYKVQWTPYE